MPEKEKNQKKKKILKSYGVWQQYNQFIRSLNIEKPRKIISRRQIIRKFAKKLVIMAMGAFFTTIAFCFFIDRFGLYNSGLNGLLQKIALWQVGTKESAYYYLLYYGMGLISNLVLIFCLWRKYRARLDIISTAIFYVLFQILWTLFFQQTGLKDRLFAKPTTPSTLPNCLIIALVAAVFHTYGYSLIFRAQATPGGLEIISAHFASKKKSNFSLSLWSKIFGGAILVLATLFDFSQAENFAWTPLGYLEYATKSHEIIATIIYILFSSFLINWFFPREQTIFLQIYSSREADRNQALLLLEKFSPTYHNTYQRKNRTEEAIYVTSCYLSGWNYFLLKPNLEATGKIYVNETS